MRVMLRSNYIRLPLAILIGALLIFPGAVLLNISTLAMPKRSLDDQAALIADHLDIRLPENTDQPVPAVILMHGCGGLRQVQEDYSQAILGAGYAAVILDSNSARGIGRFGAMSQVCTATRLLGEERAADIHATLALLSENPLINDTQIALIGWSHGGWTILDALSLSGTGERPRALTSGPARLNGVQLAIAMYPYCGFPAHSDGSQLDPAIELFSILASDDVIAPVRDCVSDYQRARSSNLPVTWEVWDGLSHAFDEPNAPRFDPRIRYDDAAAARARQRVIEQLDHAFGAG